MYNFTSGSRPRLPRPHVLRSVLGLYGGGGWAKIPYDLIFVFHSCMFQTAW